MGLERPLTPRLFMSQTLFMVELKPLHRDQYSPRIRNLDRRPIHLEEESSSEYSSEHNVVPPEEGAVVGGQYSK